MAAAYVVAASLFRAALLATGSPTLIRSALRVVLPWLAAAALWVWLVLRPDAADLASDARGPVVVGVALGTVSFALWRSTAFLVRLFLDRPSAQRATRT